MWEEVEVFNSDTSEYRRVYRIVSCPPGYALERDEERPNNDNCKVACPRYITMIYSCTHQESPQPSCTRQRPFVPGRVCTCLMACSHQH